MAQRRRATSAARSIRSPASCLAASKGIVAVLVAFSIGASLSGAVLYTYYDFRKTEAEKNANAFVKKFQKRFDTATKTINAESENAKSEIQAEIEPLKRIRAEGETLEALVKKAAPSMFFVRSLDEQGAPTVGTGFRRRLRRRPDLRAHQLHNDSRRHRTARARPSRSASATTSSRQRCGPGTRARTSRCSSCRRARCPRCRSRRRVRSRPASGVFASVRARRAGRRRDTGFRGRRVELRASSTTPRSARPSRAARCVDSDGKVVGSRRRARSPRSASTATASGGPPPIRDACDKVLQVPQRLVTGAGDRR